MGATWKHHEHLSWLLKGIKKLWGTKWIKWWNNGNIEINGMMKKLLSITKIGVSITLATPFIVLLICHPCLFTFFSSQPIVCNLLFSYPHWSLSPFPSSLLYFNIYFIIFDWFWLISSSCHCSLILNVTNALVVL